MASGLEQTGRDMNENDEKMRAVTDRLKKRDEERQAEAHKRQEVKNLTTSKEETTDSFESNFLREKALIESEITRSETLDKACLAEHFDTISTKLATLTKYLAESTIFLPAHQLTRAQQAITKLQTDIQDKRDVLIPKKKFAFKSKRKEKTAVKQTEDETDHPCLKQERPNLEIELAACKFVNQSGVTLTKNGEDLNQKDVALADLTNCVVKLHGAPSAIHINKLKNCKIFSGPVSGSVFIRECEGCIFMFPCQQLRIHTTVDTDFYIHVTSKAIIEDCSTTRFAPYNWSYPQIEEHYKISGLDKGRNNWDDVDDFNWLAADVHSPNWSLIPENQRQTEWNI